MYTKIIKLTVVCILVIGLNAAVVSYAKIDPKTIVGIWLLDEGSGNDIKDLSGNKNDGKNVDAEWVEGKFGKALEFDGTNHAEIPASATTDDYVDGFTYTIWVKPTAAPPNVNTRLIERDWHNPTIQIGPSDFYGSTEINGDQAATNIRGGTWKQDEWSFVGLTWDGATLSLFVDGETVNSKKLAKPDFTKANNSGAIWLAQWKGGAGWDFKGVIDEFAVFNVALSEDDLKAIMDKGLDGALGLSPVSSIDKMAMTWGWIKNSGGK